MLGAEHGRGSLILESGQTEWERRSARLLHSASYSRKHANDLLRRDPTPRLGCFRGGEALHLPRDNEIEQTGGMLKPVQVCHHRNPLPACEVANSYLKIFPNCPRFKAGEIRCDGTVKTNSFSFLQRRMNDGKEYAFELGFRDMPAIGEGENIIRKSSELLDHRRPLS